MNQRDSLVLHGLAVSAFLAEAGWLPDAEIILTSCQSLLADSTDPIQRTRALECCHRWGPGKGTPKGHHKEGFYMYIIFTLNFVGIWMDALRSPVR